MGDHDWNDGLSAVGTLLKGESFWVAEIDGRPGAALCDFELHDGGWAAVGEAMANVQRDLNWTDADLAASHKRVAPVWSCFLPDAGADWGMWRWW